MCMNTDILFLSIFFLSFSNTIRARTLKFGMWIDRPLKLCILFGIVKMFKIMQIRAIHIYVYSIFSNTIAARILKFSMSIDPPLKFCILFGIVDMFKIMQIRVPLKILNLISSRILQVATQMLVLCICLLLLCIYWTHYKNCRI